MVIGRRIPDGASLRMPEVIAVASVATSTFEMPTTRMKNVSAELAVSTRTPWAPAGMEPAFVTAPRSISMPGLAPGRDVDGRPGAAIGGDAAIVDRAGRGGRVHVRAGASAIQVVVRDDLGPCHRGKVRDVLHRAPLAVADARVDHEPGDEEEDDHSAGHHHEDLAGLVVSATKSIPHGSDSFQG